MEIYADFISQFPDQIKQHVEQHTCSNMVLYKPQMFIEGMTIHSADFHIIILPEPPPDTYVNDKLQSFDSGKIIAVNPGDTWFCAQGHSTKKYLSLLIKPDLIDKVAEEMGFSGDIRFLKLQNRFSSGLMQAIRSFEKETERPDTFTLMLDCLGIQIVALLLREFKTNLSKYSAYLPDSDAYIALAIEYIQVFYSANITIEDICREISVSPFHFIRTFKQKIGLSPHQYLLSVRIEKAQELLRKRQHSMAEVANQCGFVNLSHFSSKFKDITGYSPSSYKKNFNL
ncbi:MAG: hypothetical protein CVU90_12120 [Firmicutes bacterium HGW-Firmicutes-15]|nr:MAG: hypothetical protein CVU90_12120 [Firmicutes bacterium HGW-Firmicutes-15]